jgi:hypothetical protein
MKIFNSNFPIICSAMYCVSDLNLGLAVFEAGCIPSFNSLNDAYHFENITSVNDYLLWIDTDIFNYSMIDVLVKLNPKVIELVGTYQNRIKFVSLIKIKLRETYILFRSIDVCKQNFEEDGIIIKGSDGAGLASNIQIKSAFISQKQYTPNKIIIPAGGIFGKENIDWYLSMGTDYVYVGTPFALCEESRIDKKTKLTMMSNPSYIFKKHNYNKRGIILSDDYKERKNSLKDGTENKGGIIYSGLVANRIDKILTVKDMVNLIYS